MDIERTLQALLESDLRAKERSDEADKRMDRAQERADEADKRMDRAFERADLADKRMDRALERAALAEKRMDRFDKQLKATAALVKAGVKMVIEMRQERLQSKKETDFKLNALIDAQARADERQRKTDEKFNRLVELFNRRIPNGSQHS